MATTTRTAKKSIRLIGKKKKKKNKLSTCSTVLVHFFAVVSHDRNVKLPSYMFYIGSEIGNVIESKPEGKSKA